MSNLVSTVVYQSNLQPAGDILIQDEDFQKYIHDPFSLKILKQHAYLTSVQREELEKVSIHCSYANEKEYPYGTIIDTDGQKKVECRCTHIGCPYLKKCNPNADLDRIQEEQQVNSMLNPRIMQFFNSEAASFSYRGENPETSFTEVKYSEDDTAGKELSTESHKPTNSIIKPDLNPFFVDDNNETTDETYEEVNVAQDKHGFDMFVASDQQTIINQPVTERIIINAGPGTGKTWTLIEKIIRFLKENEETANNLLVLCFSKAAVEVVQKRLEQAAAEGRISYTWHYVDVRTFDSFCTYMLSWLNRNMPDRLPDYYRLEGLDYDARIKMATEIFIKYPDMLADYEHIIVDEVQDLVGVRAKLVIEMLRSLPSTCGFTLLGDACQSLYDYVSLNNPALMSSKEFYQLFFQYFPQIKYLSLQENHRQGDKLSVITEPYREAILTGTPENRRCVASNIMNCIEPVEFKLQHFQQSDALKYIHNGTLGILTRTNAQALQISSWLQTNEVPHALQRAKGELPLSSWIASVFCDYPNKSVDQNSFIVQYLTKFPTSDYGQAEKFWNALTYSQIGEPQSHYEVEDLLTGLLHNTREALLYTSPDDQSFRITVSTIHRAKGREYDSVIVLDDVITALTQSEKDDMLEHKVCYVALTRPKKLLQTVKFSPQYIYTAKNETRRCFKAGGCANRRYLSHFEVGCDNDILTSSTASEEKRQNYIKNNLQVGDRLRLIKCSELESKEAGYIYYKIVPEDDERNVLAHTSPSFAHEMENSIQTIFNHTHCQIQYKYYPRHFSDVYVESITTQLSTQSEQLYGAKAYGDLQIWTGFTIHGFAAMERDFY